MAGGLRLGILQLIEVVVLLSRLFDVIEVIQIRQRVFLVRKARVVGHAAVGLHGHSVIQIEPGERARLRGAVLVWLTLTLVRLRAQLLLLKQLI